MILFAVKHVSLSTEIFLRNLPGHPMLPSCCRRWLLRDFLLDLCRSPWLELWPGAPGRLQIQWAVAPESIQTITIESNTSTKLNL